MLSNLDIWSFEGGFGSIGIEGWGSIPRWESIIQGAINPFRQSGSYSISEIPQSWEEAQETNPEWFEPILETRPGHVADSYPQESTVVATDAQLDKEEDEMAIDWGSLISGGIDLLQGQQVGGGVVGLAPPQARDAFLAGGTVPVGGLSQPIGCDMDGIAWVGGAPPKGYKVVNYCGKGVLRKIRRRRRRRMLTASDAADLATIVGIVGKGQMASSMINRTRG